MVEGHVRGAVRGLEGGRACEGVCGGLDGGRACEGGCEGVRGWTGL